MPFFNLFRPTILSAAIRSHRAVPITVRSLDSRGGLRYTEVMNEATPANRIRVGQTVYLVSSCVRIREAVVRRCDRGLYTVQFTNTKGAIRIRGDRLYPTLQEAQQHTRRSQPLPPQLDETFGYWHNVPRWMA